MSDADSYAMSFPGGAYAPFTDVRDLMGKGAAILFSIGAIAVTAYAVVGEHWSAAVAAIVISLVTCATLSALLPWKKMSIYAFLGLFWASVLTITAAVFVFDQPALVVLLLQPIMFLTYFYWSNRPLIISHLVAVAAIYTLPFLAGVGAPEPSKLLVTLPTFLIVAALVGVLADRFRAIRKVERQRFKATIEALSTALTARDGYTGSHSHETLGLVLAACEELGLSPREKEYVADVALLHDIGKIGIPNDVLHAKGKLDKEQWQVMKEHPVIGERIVATVPGLEDVAKAIRHEHEHWDGSGYPDGLSQSSIPIASRIVLVCDAFHAMTSDRPYRLAMNDHEARMELARNAGKQFDPVVVGALLRGLDRRDMLKTEAAAVDSVEVGQFASAPA